MALVNLIIMYILRRLLLCYQNIRNIPRSVVFLIDRDLNCEYMSYNSYYLSFLPYSFPQNRMIMNTFTMLIKKIN